MKNLTGKLAATLMLTGALAMPAYAAPQPAKAGGGGHPAAAHVGGGGAPHFSGGGAPHFSGGAARSFGGGGRTFTSHAGRSLSPHVSGRSFSPHVSGRATNFSTVHPSTSFNRSVLRNQRLTNGNTVNGNLRTNRLTNSNALTRAQSRALLRNNTTGAFSRRNATRTVTPLAARQGRFASRFAARGRNLGANMAARTAWRHHWRAGFVGWYGPVFWPYAYSDIFDYAFWPDGYEDGYWDYAYDNFFDGLFWGGYGPPGDYAYEPAASSRPSRITYAAVQQLCTQPGTGITAWPFADIEKKVGLNDDQKALLGDVRKAADDAAATFKASCPADNASPITPPSRLQAMSARLQGTLDAVGIVRPPLEKFYASLSDEQKERFNALGPAASRTANNAEASAALPADPKSCTEAKPGLANLPIEKIADVVKPTDAQQDGLKQLQDATAKAVSVLQAACPEDVPLTPTGRLAAMETRLKAMIEAAKTVKPALDGFYASLNDEQKARFDRIGQQLATNG